ncbi:MAG: response regulator [Mariprofundus sp.]|nr:response regulator [Mariprofundus sp.]
MSIQRTTPLILIVDDEDMVRNILDKMLQSLGYAVIQARNSTAAQGMIRQHTPDLILLDMIMPGVDSLEVLKSIRADESLQHIAVILISGMADLDMVTTFIHAGVNDFLPKPFNKALLTLKIKTCLKQAGEHNTAHHAQQELDDFCRQLSHDLNNALTGIMMTAELLLMSASSERDKNHLADIIESTEEVTRIIHNRRQTLADD